MSNHISKIVERFRVSKVTYLQSIQDTPIFGYDICDELLS